MGTRIIAGGGNGSDVGVILTSDHTPRARIRRDPARDNLRKQMGGDSESPPIPLLPQALTGAIGLENYTGTASPQPAMTCI